MNRTTIGCSIAIVLATLAGLTACGEKKEGEGTTSATSSAAAKTALAEVVLPPIDKRDQKAQNAGGKTLKGEVCKVDKAGSEMKDAESFSRALSDGAVAPDGKLYVVDHEKKLRRYFNQKPDGCELALDKTFGTGGILDLGIKADAWTVSVAVDKAGTVYLSGGGGPKKVVDGKVSEMCGDHGDLAAGTESDTVLSGFFQVKEGKCDGPKIELKGTEVSSPKVDGVFGGEIGVNGTIKEGDRNVIKAAIYGMDGAQKLLVGKADGDEMIYYAHDVQKCALGLCVVDGNASSLRIWKMDGSFVAKIDLDGLLGTDVMPQHGAAGKNEFWVFGSARGEKKDDENDYGIIARITGM